MRDETGFSLEILEMTLCLTAPNSPACLPAWLFSAEMSLGDREVLVKVLQASVLGEV